jgi:hypothetical protein
MRDAPWGYSDGMGSPLLLPIEIAWFVLTAGLASG